MKVFDLFVSKYPPGNDLRKPTAETLEQFQGKVPAELLNFWQEYGFGNYGGGLLKIIDPTDYIDMMLWVLPHPVSYKHIQTFRRKSHGIF
ncbi:hypothetical protein GPK87_06385 [Oscillibacter sp. MCC667]|nr:hypothetical protein [Oscillibacter sp. MCC667]